MSAECPEIRLSDLTMVALGEVLPFVLDRIECPVAGFDVLHHTPHDLSQFWVTETGHHPLSDGINAFATGLKDQGEMIAANIGEHAANIACTLTLCPSFLEQGQYIVHLTYFHLKYITRYNQFCLHCGLCRPEQ
jgi:hypothetical protein